MMSQSRGQPRKLFLPADKPVEVPSMRPCPLCHVERMSTTGQRYHKKCEKVLEHQNVAHVFESVVHGFGVLSGRT